MTEIDGPSIVKPAEALLRFLVDIDPEKRYGMKSLRRKTCAGGTAAVIAAIGFMGAGASTAAADFHDAVYIRAYDTKSACQWAGRGGILTGVYQNYWCFHEGGPEAISWSLYAEF